MSRVGNKAIAVPQGVDIKIDGSTVIVKGAKGSLTREIDSDFDLSLEEGSLTVKRPTDQKRHKALHGLYRSLINNMVIGVSDGYVKTLELVGVGYKAAVQGQVLELNLGYSHNIFMEIPSEIKVGAETLKGKNPVVTLESTDKELVGEVAAKIRSLRKIEPYKGKGIRFVGEIVRRKAGKTASK
ncbi:50S ribosomal protein L6 [Reichenbachiella agarivorans]|uniref:Large ribosomal subunit protein uL6 n=1 Tax=Reichenbachiella agarivorans TaxID=2979464 RepID=A0ABY6CSG7_9BACT|nr:50S ribosomal protein L6 [Reichenbachiella agarivorans]UXP32804.1 50S ribosomal protein L6 [Reichenbachiella agarivorans]